MGKRNRNIIVETRDDVPLHDDFHWLTLGQIKALMQEPHTVNMDTRTVIVRHRSTQCEEDGRFYQSATENMVVGVDPADDRPAPPNYTWFTLGQPNTLIRYGNHLNIEARGVLACLDVQG